MPQLGFRPFDADNHYYEAEDAFTRHMDRRMAKRAVQWAEINGRKRLLIAGKIDRFIPNPTFDPVAKPGSLNAYFRGKNPEGKSMAELFGDLEPIHPAYRNRDERIKLLDQQGLEGVLLFPTQGVGVEQPLRHDAAATLAAVHAFNQWLHEDWGFAYLDRIFAVPMVSLVDPRAAAAELEWALERGARLVNLRPAPVPQVGGSLSPADPTFDPFWSRVNEAGIAVSFHAADSGYGKHAAAWEGRGAGRGLEAFRGYAFGTVTQADRAIYDTLASLVIHGLFQRHPRVRVCSIENGSEWVDLLLRKLQKCYGQTPQAFSEPPETTFRRHISIAPYFEDDIRGLADRIGVNNVLFGSDFPHAEGLADPLSFIHELKGFSDDELRLVMRENSLKLIQPGTEPTLH